MTAPHELTLEELAEGEAVLAECPDHEAVTVLAYFYRHRRALLAMARELLRIRSALDHLGNCPGVVLVMPLYQADIDAENMIEAAVELGWLDPSPPAAPEAELKGGE